MATEVITGSMAHSYEVMRRRTTSYDYEKVFWNSAYGLGLLGLGWVAVKLGFMIGAVQKVADDVETAITQPDLVTYQYLFAFVEGERKNDPVPFQPLGTQIVNFKRDPEAWALYKDEVMTAHPEWFNANTGKLVEKDRSVKILEALDGLYASWGAVMPAALLAANVGVEYARVWRIKREMDET